VASLAQQKLPASLRSQGIVRDILRQETLYGRTLYAKTGWRFSSNPQLGWWTGWVERDGQISTFALNIDPASRPTQRSASLSGEICSASSAPFEQADMRRMMQGVQF
jgi:beta-lactamase class D